MLSLTLNKLKHPLFFTIVNAMTVIVCDLDYTVFLSFHTFSRNIEKSTKQKNCEISRK